jgi:glycosyltransferase involved in cell wall biosynthesis
MMPLVSTIIPAYNAAGWVGDVIRSVLDQGVDQEIIVIVDGSTDATATVAASFVEPVRVVSQPNCGVSGARTRGLGLAKGEFIAFLDADDVWLPGKLNEQLVLFRECPALGTVICDEVELNPDGTVWHESFLATRSFFQHVPKHPAVIDRVISWLLTDSLFTTSGVKTRRAIAAEVGFFDTDLTIVEDPDYWIRLALGAPVGLVPDALVCNRAVNRARLSTAHKRDWAMSLKVVLDRHHGSLLERRETEGSNARKTLAGQYLLAVGECWCGDRVSEASALFVAAARLGHTDWLKLLASGLRIAPAARRAKALFS